MSKVRLSVGIFALALLTAGPSVGTATAGPTSAKATVDGQATAIKDGWLVTKLHSLFVPEDALSGSNIDVDVKAGMVTLQGTVPNAAARARAIAIAKGADGVKGVTDQMRIAIDPSSMDRSMDKAAGKMDRAADKAERKADRAEDKADRAADKTVVAGKKTGRAVDDGWIKSKIYAQYMADWNTVLNDSDIDVDVDNGVVSLSGTVKTAAARAKAVSIAKATDGVKSVKDTLKVAATY